MVGLGKTTAKEKHVRTIELQTCVLLVKLSLI